MMYVNHSLKNFKSLHYQVMLLTISTGESNSQSSHTFINAKNFPAILKIPVNSL